MKRMRHYIFSVLMLLCMLFAFSAMAGAAEADVDEAPEQSYVYLQQKGTKYYLRYTATKKLVKGTKGILELPKGSKNYYYVYANGRVRVNQFTYVSGNTYYSGADGRFAKGFMNFQNGTIRYFRQSDGLLFRNGWVKYNNKYYRAANGIIQKGFVKVGKYVYYLDPANSGARVNGWKTISGKVYYFSKKAGIMITGFKSINGKKYYFDTSGVRQSGLQKIDGKLYYFSAAGVMKTGSRKINDKYYYFSAEKASYGQALTGWVTINGKKYVYDKTNFNRLIGAWYTDPTTNKKYYLNETTGAMVTGEYTIGGTKYTFDSDGVLQQTSWRDYTPNYIRVNLSTNIVTVYSGLTPLRAFYCSPGADNETYKEIGGRNLYLMDKLRWHELMGPSWGQYCEHLSSSILFHSVPYQSQNNAYSLLPSTFNNLGSAVSHGCIRLATIDAYYIYTYCPGGVSGTRVRVDYFGNTDPIVPTKYHVNNNSQRSYIYDPTDPNINGNGEKYLNVTARYVQFDL